MFRNMLLKIAFVCANVILHLTKVVITFVLVLIAFVISDVIWAHLTNSN